MWHSRKFISKVLIIALMIGLFGTGNYSKASVRTDEIESYATTRTQTKATPAPTKPTPTLTKPTPTLTKPTPTPKLTKPEVDLNNTPYRDIAANLEKYKKIYPYINLEEPAKLEGIEFELQDDVEFLPENASYNIEAAPIKSYKSQSDLSTPNSNIDLSSSDKTYLPGTDLLKFKNNSFIPQKGKIYIDENTQTSYRVIDDAVSGSSGVEVAVVKPKARDVFKSIYIPSQEVRLTKGNITDMLDGVTLVDNDSKPSKAQLPAPDTSRDYHEFNIPEMVLYEYPEKPGKKPVETEQPKGKTEPTQKPTPTPHPEERDAMDASNNESASIVVKLKGGKIRVYEPTLICDADWDGEFNLGFESMIVESSLLVESKIKFEKEMCVRLYGYGLDYDSGTEILGRSIAAHIGVGIYAVIGVNGEITITAKIETAGDISGGVTGNFWGVLIGIPSALPYAWYDSKNFDAAILLNGKINAWAYVGPQLTLDVLDFNLLTAQVWLGLEAEAIIEGEVSEENGASIQLDLSADLVALFKAWLFDIPFEYYLVKYRIFEKTFQYKTGAMVGGDSQKDKKITPVIQIDGACAHRDTIWGTVWYEDELAGITYLANTPIVIEVNRNGITTYIQINTDSSGNFEYKFSGTNRLLPTDTISITIDHVVEDGDQVITYRARTLKPIHPTIPFKPFVLEADGFNDIVTGTVSPCKTPLPGYPEEEQYEGYIYINVVDKEGDLVERKRVYASDGVFEADFDDASVLSGGHKVMAVLNFETSSTDSGYVDVNLNNLNFIVECYVDDVDAALIQEMQMDRIGQFGIMAQNVIAKGSVTNLKDGRPFEGNVYVSVGSPIGSGWEDNIPLDLNYEVPDLTRLNKSNSIVLLGLNDLDLPDDEDLFDLDNEYGPDEEELDEMIDRMLLPVSTFSLEVGSDTLGDLGRFVTYITFEFEYEGMIKRFIYDFAFDDSDIAAEQINPVDQQMTDTIESLVNWPDVMITMGQSQMRINGRIRSIDGRGNTSIMMVGDKVFIPVEAVVEALGGSVSYDSKQKMTIKLSDKSIVAYNGKSSITKNGKSTRMEAASFMSDNGTMMFPLSFFSKTLGLKTEWSADTKTLSVWSAK